MLREALTQIESRLQRLKLLQNAAHDEEVYSSRLQQLRGEQSRLAPVYEGVRLLRANGIVVEIPIEHGQRSHDEFQLALDRFITDPNTITGKGVLRDTLQLFPSFVDNVRKNSLMAWQQYINSRTLNYNASILSLLERVPAFQPVVSQIKRCQLTIDSARSVLPSSQVQISRVDQAITDLKAAWTSLDSGDLPASVTTFLQAAGKPEGARLSLLTDEVRAWLLKHEVEGAFYVRV